jgi:DNA-binding NarL/FixJ family response regulator
VSPPETPVGEARIAGGTIRILIIAKQQFIADALEALLGNQSGMVVVAKVNSADDIAELAADLHPDVMILDFRVRDEAVLAAIKTIFESGSLAKVIFLAGEESDQVLLAAIEVGASAVLDLSSPADEVIHAVRTASEGGSLISPVTISTLLSGRRKTDFSRDRLTHREAEILGLMADGASNRDMAASLGISYTTVRCHVRNLSGKLAAHSKLEILVKAQRLDLVGRRVLPEPVHTTHAQNL